MNTSERIGEQAVATILDLLHPTVSVDAEPETGLIQSEEALTDEAVEPPVLPMNAWDHHTLTFDALIASPAVPGHPVAHRSWWPGPVDLVQAKSSGFVLGVILTAAAGFALGWWLS